MLLLQRTDASNADFRKLVELLDAELSVRDGDEHPFFAQFNKLDSIPWVVVAYENGLPVGCGAIKKYADDTVEVKRMFTHPTSRGKGIASFVLTELEKWAAELGFTKCILETGIRQPEAIALYHKCGYLRIPNYGQYEASVSSLCFEKKLG
jgi:GNAT superfamily N-acetyltransferase